VINKYYDILLEDIFNENIKYETLLNLNELFNVLRIYNFSIKLNNNKKEIIHQKLLLIIIFMETLNKNSFCVKLLVEKYLKVSKIEISELDENVKIIISLGNDFYKSVNNESLFNVNFNLHLTLRKTVNLKKIYINYDQMIKEKAFGNINILNRFCCHPDHKFYLHCSYNKNKVLEMNKYIQIIENII
jgi:hypothetical protein